MDLKVLILIEVIGHNFKNINLKLAISQKIGMKIVNRLAIRESDFTEICSINPAKEWIWREFNAFNKEIIRRAVEEYYEKYCLNSGD